MDSQCETVEESTPNIKSEREKYDNLLNEVNSLKDIVKSSKQNHYPAFESDSNNCIKIPVKDFENLLSRVTLLENKLMIIEVSCKCLNKENIIEYFYFEATKSTVV